MTKHTTDATTLFFQKLSKAASPFRHSIVDSTALRRDAGSGLASLERLRQYHAYLEQARDYKASGAARAHPIDRQVLVHARDALGDIRTLATSAMRVVRNLHAGGVLDRLVESFRQGVSTVSSVGVADAWTMVTAAGPTRDAMHLAGATDSLLEALGAGIRSTDARLSAGAELVTIEGTFNGAAAAASILTTPRPAHPSNVVDLISRSRFDAIADAVEQGAPAYLDGVPYVANGVRSEDVALFGALAACVEGTRHVRKLEDTGLETYRGAGPAAPIILYIALGIIVIGGIMMADCYDKTQSQQDASESCSIGKFIFTLGTAVILGLWASSLPPASGPGSTPVNMGTPVIHGVVRDLALSAS